MTEWQEVRGKRQEASIRLAIEITGQSLAPSIDKPSVHQIAEPLMIDHGLVGEWILDLSFVDQAKMRRLNRESQGHDEPTDVLSFPVHFSTHSTDPHNLLPADGPQLLGSIVIAPDIAAQQAPQHQRSTYQEIVWLIDHGLHHLLGYDHDDYGHWRPRSFTRLVPHPSITVGQQAS